MTKTVHLLLTNDTSVLSQIVLINKGFFVRRFCTTFFKETLDEESDVCRSVLLAKIVPTKSLQTESFAYPGVLGKGVWGRS